MSCGGNCDCSSCYSSGCEGRNSQSGFGFTPTSTPAPSAGSMSGGSFLSSLTGTALSFVPGGNIVGTLVSTIGSLFGAAPRGDFAKFKRTAYPYMRRVASQSGIPATIGWFGDVVMVKPDGSFGVVAPQTSNYEANLIQAGYHPFYAATCAISDCVNHPEQLGWQLFDPFSEATTILGGKLEATIPPGGVLPASGGVVQNSGGVIPTTGGGISTSDMSTFLLYGGIGIGLFLLLSGEGRKK